MAVSQLPQAPYRQDRKIFPTPIIGDVLFSEVRDCNRGNPFPEYGSPYPNANKWPDHKLVYIKPVDIERNEIFEFFYAADRENQDLYNFSSGYRNVVGNAGGREFRVVQRSYVTLRENFQPLDIEFGAAMPNIPEDKFDGVEYVFFDRQQQRINEQELDSLYVAEVHTYIETAFLDYKLSYGTQKSDLVPEKFRAAIPQTTTEQIVEGLAEQPVLTGSQLSVTEDQINPDIKLVKIVSREEPDDDISLIGKRAYVEGGPPANTIETYSKDEIEVDTGVNVVQSTVTPLGDGSFVKETVEVESWPELKGSEWDYLLNTQVVSTQQMVVPPTTFNEPNTSYRAVNEDRSLKIVEEAPIAALNSYLISLPTRTDIQMPTVLKSITTYWTYDSSGSDGDASSSGTMPATGGGTLECMASSSGQFREAAIPTIATEVESVFGSDIPATIYFFYYNSGNGSMSETDLRNRLSSLIGQQINVWPTFKPQAHTIVATGGSVTASAKAVASETILQSIDGVRGNAQGVQTDSSFSRDVNKDIVNLAPTIHRALTVINADQYKSVGARASARARLDGDFNADARSNESTGSLTVSVQPSSFPATTPSDIPRSGLYIVDSKAEPFKWGWVKCSATVVNAGLFAS
jgi:hypothetical protein